MFSDFSFFILPVVRAGCPFLSSAERFYSRPLGCSCPAGGDFAVFPLLIDFQTILRTLRGWAFEHYALFLCSRNTLRLAGANEFPLSLCHIAENL